MSDEWGFVHHRRVPSSADVIWRTVSRSIHDMMEHRCIFVRFENRAGGEVGKFLKIKDFSKNIHPCDGVVSVMTWRHGLYWDLEPWDEDGTLRLLYLYFILKQYLLLCFFQSKVLICVFILFQKEKRYVHQSSMQCSDNYTYIFWWTGTDEQAVGPSGWCTWHVSVPLELSSWL